MYDILIEAGLIFLLIYTPLAFGGVTEYAHLFLNTVAGGLLLVWLLKTIARRHRRPAGVFPRPGQSGNYLTVKRIPGWGALFIFFLLAGAQLIPLPSAVVQRLSPETHYLYTHAAETLLLPPPQYMPLSVSSQATEVELYSMLAYAIVFFLIIHTVRTPGRIRRISVVIILMGLLEAGYSLFQMLAGKQLIYFYAMNASNLNGSFINKNHFAGYVGMAMWISIGQMFTLFEPTASTSSSIKLSVPARVKRGLKILFWCLVVMILLTALLLSGSRGAVVSLCAGVCVFLALAWARRLNETWPAMVTALLVIVALLGLFLTPTLGDELIERLTRYTASLHVRIEVWKSAWHIFRDFPFFGSGLGTFGHLSRRYQTFRAGVYFRYAESDWLQLLAETGIVGTGALILFGALFVKTVLRRWKFRRSGWAIALITGYLSAMAFILLHGLVDFNLHIPSNALVFTVIAALSYVTGLTRENREHER